MELPSIGDVFAGQYRIDGSLGRGGFAHVYRATRLADGLAVALKVLTPRNDGYDRETRSRFGREVSLVGQLTSPNVVKLLNSGTAPGGLLYMTFELVGGRDLSEVLQTHKTLDPEVVQHILMQVLVALKEAHRLGLLHRDIKPDNIRVFSDGVDPWRIKLLDFGIARPSDPATTQITEQGSWVGTPRYMAPEQLHHRELSPASDIYSLGVTAFQMLMGSDAMAPANLGGQLPRLMDSRALHVPKERARHLTNVLHRMVSREPRERFGSAHEVLTALGASFPASVTIAERRPVFQPVVMLGGGVAVIVVAAIAVARWSASEAPPKTPDRPVPTSIIRGAIEPELPENPPEDTPDASVSAPIEAPPERFTAACKGIETPWAVDVWTRPDMDDGREVGVFIPRSEPLTPLPVVLMFHMKLRSDRDFFDDSGIEAVARKHGFVVIAPRDRGQMFPWTDEADLDLPEQLIDWVGEKICLDRERVFVMGNGDGAQMADQVRCQMRVAGIVTANHRALPLCEPPEPVPHLHFVSLKDRALALDADRCGLEQTPIPTLNDFSFAWHTANACDESPPEISEFERMRCRRWACEAAFMRCDVDAGWGWPFQEPNPTRDLLNCNGDGPTGVPMAETAWEFFAATGPPPPDQSMTPH